MVVEYAIGFQPPNGAFDLVIVVGVAVPISCGIAILKHGLYEVEDDGRGFDTEATGLGTGVQGMIDRVSALGGTLRVVSTPGAATRVVGQIPVG